jgi:type I restriction enzyme S subunit
MTRTKLSELLVDVQSGFASGDDLEAGGVLQVRMNNVETDGSWNWSARRMVPATGKQLERCLLVDGDVLFNATNSPELVGKTALFTGAAEAVVFSNHFLRLRTDVNRLAPAFLAYWLRAQWARGIFRTLCNAWVNQASVRKEALLGLEIDLPSLVEQQRIAAMLDVPVDQVGDRLDALDLLFHGWPAANPAG